MHFTEHASQSRKICETALHLIEGAFDNAAYQ